MTLAGAAYSRGLLIMLRPPAARSFQRLRPVECHRPRLIA